MASHERQLAKKDDIITRMKAANKKRSDEAGNAMQAGVRTGAGMGAAFGVGYFEHAWPDKAQVLGIDVSLLVGVLGTAVGAFGLAGKDKQTNDVIEAVGNGSLFAYAAKKGAEMGDEKAAGG